MFSAFQVLFPEEMVSLTFFFRCMHSPLTSSTSTSVSNFPHCPEWVENPRRTRGNVLHSAVGLGTVKAACLTQTVMSCGCTAFWSTEDPVRARSCIYWDGFLHIWWTSVHNGVSVKKLIWHFGKYTCSLTKSWIRRFIALLCKRVVSIFSSKSGHESK